MGVGSDDLQYSSLDRMIEMQNEAERDPFRRLRTALEWLIAPVGLVFVAPVVLLTALAVFLTSRSGSLTALLRRKADSAAAEIRDLSNFETVWKCAGFLLPRKIREREYEAGIHDLRLDLSDIKSLHPRGRKRDWFVFCLWFRTFLFVGGCYSQWVFKPVIRLSEKILAPFQWFTRLLP